MILVDLADRRAHQGGQDTVVCQCGYTSSWRYPMAAGGAATWHLYEAHPAQWREVIGDRRPVDPRPEAVLYQPSAN